MWVECSGFGSGAGGIERRHHREANARERQEVKALWRALHGDEEVAAGDGSGCRGARARGHQGRGKRSGLGGDDAWAGVAAGGGAREVCAGGERRWQAQRAERKRRARGRRSREVSGGLVCDF
jgi:hypothetical protein